MGAAERASTSPPSRRRRLAFRLGSAVAAFSLALAAARWWGSEWRQARDLQDRAESRDGRRIPTPGDTLLVHCEARDGYCARTYGPDVTFCHRADCESPVTGFTTTPQGFVGPRGRIYDEHAPAGTVRILALGGSTTGGPPWEQSWPGQLERVLSERARRDGLPIRFEVLDLGLSGAGSLDSWKLYQALGARFSPDVVILGEEVNDLGGCAPFTVPSGIPQGGSQEAVVAEVLAGERDPASLDGLSPWFARHRGAFERARAERTTRAKVDEARGWVLGAAAGRPSSRSPEELERACTGAASPELFESPSIFDDYTDGWSFTRASYDRIAALARASGATLVVSTVPHDFEDWRCPTPTCAPLLTLHDWRRYLVRVHNPAVRAYGAELGAIVVDLEATVDRFGRGEAPPDVHAADVFLGFAARHVVPPEALEARFARGELGKAPLFAWEWMHPSTDGYRLIAALYADALWPIVSASGR